jgi:hypothetical protein
MLKTSAAERCRILDIRCAFAHAHSEINVNEQILTLSIRFPSVAANDPCMSVIHVPKV